MGSNHLEGARQVAAAIGHSEQRITEAVRCAVYGQGLALAELINRKTWVPVRTGALRGSLYVTRPITRSSGEVVSEIGYSAPYADEVHQRPSDAPSSAAPGTRVKQYRKSGWITRAVAVHARALYVRLSESFARALRSGQTMDALLGAGIPTSPPPFVEPIAGSSRRLPRYGFSRDQRAALRRLKKSGAISLVRRFRRPKKAPR